jgi:hypothetical protein
MNIAATPAAPLSIELEPALMAQLEAAAEVRGVPAGLFISALAARLLRDEIGAGISDHGTPWNFSPANTD